MFRLIKKLIVGLITLVAILGVITISGYIYVRTKYDIDLFNTVNQLKTLSQKVNEEEVCPNAYGEEDQVNVMDEVNQSVDNLITYTEENGYQIALDGIPENMKNLIRLSDKQVAALADIVIKEQTNNQIEVNGKQVPFYLKQIDFLDIDTKGNAKFNTVIYLDLTPFKEDMKGFPFRYLNKYVPDGLYISSTVNVLKGDVAFAYEVSHDALAINNLKAEDTEDLFHTLNTVLKMGSAEDLNKQMGDVIVGALIGTEENPGFAYSLKEYGASDYTFETENDLDYFVVKMDVL